MKCELTKEEFKGIFDFVEQKRINGIIDFKWKGRNGEWDIESNLIFCFFVIFY